ncbi:hypothetical protein AWB91_23080 [Mycobacterium paraense]|uniref:Uncharacterized protein n=1 Tax=Mycobacterium paraense TaxID=767916 RepID=A0ABX3VJB7_9MYCO|nr:hypothetical protein AWB91_23080 [Mycobacterium paraense]ORW35035.1 hypothetical protein AWB88_27295 [Mycobacterium paraense]
MYTFICPHSGDLSESLGFTGQVEWRELYRSNLRLVYPDYQDTPVNCQRSNVLSEVFLSAVTRADDTLEVDVVRLRESVRYHLL